MKLIGKIIKGTKLEKTAVIEKDDTNTSFRDLLEECLLNLCKELDIPVPMWLTKNTKEFVAYRKTFFTREQFVEKIPFDKFEIRLE